MPLAAERQSVSRTRMAKKRLERWYVEQLRRALPDFPTGAVADDESPDFIVGSGPEATGIEITAFYWPAPAGERRHQEQQALKDRVVGIAQKVHTAAGGPGLYVSVFFGKEVSVTKRDAQELGEAIARAVLDSRLPVSLDEPAVRVSWERLPRGVVDITIRASVDGRDRLWSADTGGWVAPVQPAHIQDVVERKAGMLPLARTKCQNVWLVTVNDEFSRAVPVELTEASERSVYEHMFDRLVWLEPHRQRACGLRSRPANRPLQPTSGAKAHAESEPR
jgi:hypothetical protein